MLKMVQAARNWPYSVEGAFCRDVSWRTIELDTLVYQGCLLAASKPCNRALKKRPFVISRYQFIVLDFVPPALTDGYARCGSYRHVMSS